MKLYDYLLQLRNDLARKKDVPYFMVFKDEEIREIAQKKPRNIADFQNIHGVNRSGQGEIKAEEYGEAFIKVINGFLKKESQKFQEGNEIQELEETEYAILQVLYSDARSVGELAEQFAIEKSSIQKILNVLRNIGLIDSHRESRRNGILFFSTPEGKKYFQMVQPPGTE